MRYTGLVGFSSYDGDSLHRREEDSLVATEPESSHELDLKTANREVLLAFIAELKAIIVQQQTFITEQQTTITQLQQRVAALEAV